MSDNSTPRLSIGLVALLVSVALNGVLIGLLLAGSRAPSPMGAAPTDRADAPQKNQWRQDFRAHMQATNQDDMQEAMQTYRESRRALNSLVESGTASASDIKLAMDQVRANREVMAEIGDASIVSFLQTLPANQRKNALRALQPRERQAGRRGPGGRERGRRGERPRQPQH